MPNLCYCGAYIGSRIPPFNTPHTSRGSGSDDQSAMRHLFRQQTNLFLSPEHHDNVKKWIGTAVSTLISNCQGLSLMPSEAEAKEHVLRQPEVIKFIKLFDPTGEAFEAFWVFDEKVHGKIAGGKSGGLNIWKKRHTEQIAQLSKKAVSKKIISYVSYHDEIVIQT